MKLFVLLVAWLSVRLCVRVRVSRPYPGFKHANAVGDILKFSFPKQKILVVFPPSPHQPQPQLSMAHASYAQFVSTEIGINGITRALRAVREAAEDDTLLAQVTPNCPGYLCVCECV